MFSELGVLNKEIELFLFIFETLVKSFATVVNSLKLKRSQKNNSRNETRKNSP